MNIYVGNIPFTATADDVRRLFEPYGAVEQVKLIMDRDTGRSRGFGFVAMPDPGEAKTAIEALHSADFSGRSLRVNEARPRQQRPRHLVR